jgi:AcrR family transcriptional regulator
MSDSNAPEAKPYHHGDLRRALVDAARRLLEAEGPAAMSLRAVAREAGVSPAAPYHHFKDKSDLMGAIASEGWALLGEAMVEAHASHPDDSLAVITSYVRFARSRPALYRVMFEAARESEKSPFADFNEETNPYVSLRKSLVERDWRSEADLEVWILASWASAHGLAEMLGFRHFEEVKQHLGGEEPFVRAVLERMAHRDKPR